MKRTNTAQGATMTAAFLMLIATLGSCSKGDNGATGPQGATGATGAMGSTGATGANGTNGTNGNANVKAGTVTLNASLWYWDASSYSSYTTINDAQITADVINNGTVAVFVSDGGSGWYALPYTDYPTNTTSYTLNYDAAVGEVLLTLTYSNYTNTSSPFTTATIKIVAIAGSLRKANPSVNWNNYNEVQPFLKNVTVTSLKATK